jgi:hypothetical protein
MGGGHPTSVRPLRICAHCRSDCLRQSKKIRFCSIVDFQRTGTRHITTSLNRCISTSSAKSVDQARNVRYRLAASAGWKATFTIAWDKDARPGTVRWAFRDDPNTIGVSRRWLHDCAGSCSASSRRKYPERSGGRMPQAGKGAVALVPASALKKPARKRFECQQSVAHRSTISCQADTLTNIGRPVSSDHEYQPLH